MSTSSRSFSPVASVSLHWEEPSAQGSPAADKPASPSEGMCTSGWFPRNLGKVLSPKPLAMGLQPGTAK